MILGDICYKGSSSLKLKDISNDGPYPVVGASGTVGYSKTYRYDVPYLALVKDGAGVGRVIPCPKKSSILGTMQAIIPNPNVELEYLTHLLQNANLGAFARVPPFRTSILKITAKSL